MSLKNALKQTSTVGLFENVGLIFKPIFQNHSLSLSKSSSGSELDL